MSFSNRVSNVAEQLHLLTEIPIQSFKLNGNPISSIGHNGNFNRIFNRYNIYEEIIANVNEGMTEFTYIPPNLGDVYYIVCPICPRNIYRGIFVIGPCSDTMNNPYNIPYKPLKIKPHILTTVKTIWKGSSCKTKLSVEDNAYGLHIRKAIDYIDARYKEDITLSQVADFLNISKPYFCSLFKREVGETFTQFLNKKRIEKSKEFLLNNDYSILDIALMVGFTNQNYYQILFKKLTNQTPMEYRNNNIGDN